MHALRYLEVDFTQFLKNVSVTTAAVEIYATIKIATYKIAFR